MKKILSSLNDFIKKARELDEEIAVSYIVSGGKKFIVAVSEDKELKYQERVPDYPENYIEYDPERDEFIDCIDILASLKSHINAVQRTEELTDYLKKQGINAYNTDERRSELEFAEFIGRSKLNSNEFKNYSEDMDEEEKKELAIKIGMEVIRRGESNGC